MKIRDAGISVLAVVAALALIGIAARYITKQPDGPLEEQMEEHAENLIENHLGLDDEALDGLIDLSPGSPEK